MYWFIMVNAVISKKLILLFLNQIIGFVDGDLEIILEN